jgi:hypothetical protein
MTWHGARGVTCPSCNGGVVSTNDSCLCCELCGHRWSASVKTPVPTGQDPAPTLHCTCGKVHSFTAPMNSGSYAICTKCVTDWELIDNIMGGQMWVMKMSWLGQRTSRSSRKQKTAVYEYCSYIIPPVAKETS